MTTESTFPIPFDHAVAAVDPEGNVLWSQGKIAEVFPLASVTKIITSLGVLVAVQRGALDLAAEVGSTPAGQRYTLSHLLSHSSGLAVEGDGTCFKDSPGHRRIYSNQGFEVLGKLLEQAVEVPFHKWIDREVCAPLGMRATVVPGSAARSGFSNIIDLTLLIEELLEPQLLNPRLHRALTSTALPGLRGLLPGYGMQRNNDWGLGVEIKGDKSPHWTPLTASQRTFGHFGMSGSFLWVDPERRVGAAFLGSQAFGPEHVKLWPLLGQAILDSAIGGSSSLRLGEVRV